MSVSLSSVNTALLPVLADTPSLVQRVGFSYNTFLGAANESVSTDGFLIRQPTAAGTAYAAGLPSTAGVIQINLGTVSAPNYRAITFSADGLTASLTGTALTGMLTVRQTGVFINNTKIGISDATVYWAYTPPGGPAGPVTAFYTNAIDDVNGSFNDVGAGADQFSNQATGTASTNLAATLSTVAGNATPVVITVADTTPPALPVINVVAGNDVVNAAEKALGVTISGTAEANSTISGTWGGTAINAVTNGAGVWTTTIASGSVPADAASTTISVTATDAALNTSVAATRTVAIDSTPPTAPTIGVVATDDLINAAEQTATVTVSGVNEAGATTTLNGVAVTQATPTTWTAVLSAAAITAFGEGPETLTAVSTDAAGNTTTATRGITVDTVGPTAPTIGIVATDDIINAAEQIATVTVSGVNEAGATTTLNGVAVTQGTPTTWTAVLSGAAITAFGEGPETLTAVSTDAAGNTTTATRAITVDTIAPTSPTIGLVATDDIINAAEQTATVTVSGVNEAGSTTTLNGVAVTQGTPTTWTAVLSAAAITAFGEGPETLTAVSTDAAGNTTTATRGITVDTVGPTAPTIGIVATDDLINAAEQTATVTVSGVNEAGATTTLNGVAVTQATPTTWTAVLSAAAITAFGEGPETLTAVSTDAAGNTTTATRGITVDTVGPTAPTIGIVATDDIINAAEQIATVTVSGVNEAGATTTLNGVAVTQGTPTTWTAVLSGAAITAFGEGPETLTAVSTDAAGNTTTATRAITVDTIAPTSPTIGLVATDDIINAAEQTATVTVSGVNEAGSTTTLNGVAVTQGTPTTWTAVLSAAAITAFGEGPETLTAVSTDAAGNTTTATRGITVDTVGPTAPTIGIVATDDIINAAEQTATVTVSGVNEAGATTTLNGVAVTQGTPTTWTAVLSAAAITAFGEGPETLTAVSTDAAGNTTTATRAITVDTIAPTSPTIGLVATDDIINAAEQTATVTVSGVNEAGSTTTLNGVAVTQGTPTTWTAVLSAAAITAFGEGPETLTAVSTDAAGNTTTATRGITVDTIAPTSPTIGLVATDDIINAAEQTATVTVSGVNEAGATTTLNGVAVTQGTPTTWTAVLSAAAITAFGEGPETLTAVSTDAAGNTTTATRGITVDTVGPTAPTIGIVATDDIINAAEQIATVTVSGVNEAGATTTLNGVAVTQGTPTTWTAVLSGAAITAFGQGPETLTAVSTDAAGNTTTATRAITVDTVAPAVTFASAHYDSATNTLLLFATTGTMDLTPTVELKNSLDWSQFTWDLAGAPAVGTAANISTATVAGDTLKIVFDSAYATSLEGTVGFGTSDAVIDNIDITAGFAVDAAGNVGSGVSPNIPVIGSLNEIDLPRVYSANLAASAVISDDTLGDNAGSSINLDAPTSTGFNLLAMSQTAAQLGVSGNILSFAAEAGESLVLNGGGAFAGAGVLNAITVLGASTLVDGGMDYTTQVKFAGGSQLIINNGMSSTVITSNLGNTAFGLGFVTPDQTGAGDDQLIAGSGGDRMLGNAGNDLLIGGAGGDALYGGSGNDILFGAAGNDYSVGGSGTDTYVFIKGAMAYNGSDVISGFTTGTDKIYVSNDAMGSGVTAASIFAGATISGSDTLLTINAGETIRLLGVTLAVTDIQVGAFQARGTAYFA